MAKVSDRDDQGLALRRAATPGILVDQDRPQVLERAGQNATARFLLCGHAQDAVAASALLVWHAHGLLPGRVRRTPTADEVLAPLHERRLAAASRRRRHAPHQLFHPRRDGPLRSGLLLQLVRAVDAAQARPPDHPHFHARLLLAGALGAVRSVAPLSVHQGRQGLAVAAHLVRARLRVCGRAGRLGADHQLRADRSRVRLDARVAVAGARRRGSGQAAGGLSAAGAAAEGAALSRRGAAPRARDGASRAAGERAHVRGGL
mmetsp:Transcript_35770/g.90670  ORF Transcript_35770/g.90670 Transcript_35770/m.90670 type:complete len:261 (-) Transcript_35770:219-1001(-)